MNSKLTKSSGLVLESNPQPSDYMSSSALSTEVMGLDTKRFIHVSIRLVIIIIIEFVIV